MAKLRVVFAEALCQNGMDLIGDNFDYKAEKLEGAALVQAVSDFKPDVLVVQNTQVDQSILQAHQGLELVLNVAEGFQNVSTEVASAQGTLVAHLPDVVTAQSVSEYSFALLTALNRRIYDNVTQLSNGKWNKDLFSKSTGIKNNNLGIYGCGQCAREVAKAAKAFELNVQLFSPCECFAKCAASQKLVDVVVPDFATLAKNNLFVVVVAPSCSQLKPLDQTFFDNVQSKSIIINVTSQGVVDEQALLNALNTKNIQYGSDFPAQNAEINKHASAYVTDHVATRTQAVRRKFWKQTLEVLLQYSKDRTIDNKFLANAVKGAEYVTFVARIKRAENLGALSAVLKEKGFTPVEVSINNLGETAVVRVKTVKGADLEGVKSAVSGLDFVIKTSVL